MGFSQMLNGSAERGSDSTRLATFDEYRGLLFSIAYRMLGSIQDAEDMLQEAFIRWQSASDDDVRSPKAFLMTIVSRLCINHLQSARVRREQYVGQWLPEPLLIDSHDPQDIVRIDETLSMALLVLLERLMWGGTLRSQKKFAIVRPPPQRDLDFPPRERRRRERSALGSFLSLADELIE